MTDEKAQSTEAVFEALPKIDTVFDEPAEPTLVVPAVDAHAVRGYHMLVIPVDGYFHMFHSNDEYTTERVRTLAEQFNGPLEGGRALAPIEAKIDDTSVRIWFNPDPDLPTNDRAREILAEVFGWHMTFEGAVLVDGLPEDEVVKILAE